MTTRKPARDGFGRASLLALGGLGLATSPVPAQTPAIAPPGVYGTSWVGNTFGGDGGGNGAGRWVQNAADEIEVAPDGTVIAGVSWDEGGRCVGLYKDGKVNTTLLKGKEGGPETAWGWNTGNNAVAVRGNTIYVANTGKQLLRFRWTPGDLNSAKYLDEVTLPAEAVGLAARLGFVTVVYKDSVEDRRASDLSVVERTIPIKDARDVAVREGDASLWVLEGNVVRRYGRDEHRTDIVLQEPERPSAVSLDPSGRLIVCDDGPRQQVLVYDIEDSDKPRLVRSYGERGGLHAGRAGRVDVRKFFSPRGAGFDAAGNFYVAMSFTNGPPGNLVIRSFAADGTFRWEVASHAFVDTFGFADDGKSVYGRTAIFDLELGNEDPGSEWRLRSLTIDHLKAPDDPRIKFGDSTLVRDLAGRRTLFCIGQYGGGYRIYTFGPGDLAHEVAKVGGDDQWAWDVDDAGTIWHGDAPGKTIRRYPFRGWTSDDKPDYDWAHPETRPWPGGWELIRRINYERSTDTLYLTGYLKGQRIETWGVAGATARRFDGWSTGKPTLKWSIDLPRDGNQDAKEGPITPSSIDVAGDYLFAGMVKPLGGKQFVHILRLSDGKHFGTFEPGPAVGGNAGWLDMPYSIQASKRSDGEYLVLVEEDFRGKNLLYRWWPDGKKPPTLE